MARNNDDQVRQVSIGMVTVEGRLGRDIVNIGKNDRVTIAATVFGNSVMWNGHEGSLKFNVIINGPRAEAIWEQRDLFKKGAWVVAHGELFAGEEYEGETQLEVTGWNAYLNPNFKWAEDSSSRGGGGGSRRSRRDDDDDDDRSSRRSSRGRSSRRDEDDEEDSGSRRSSRRTSRRDEEDDDKGGDDDRSSRSRRRSRVRDEGDDD